jgi:hypothetical protein
MLYVTIDKLGIKNNFVSHQQAVICLKHQTALLLKFPTLSLLIDNIGIGFGFELSL